VIWYASKNRHSWKRIKGQRQSIDDPCLTISAGGLGSDAIWHWHLYRDADPDPRPAMNPQKPPYAPLPPTTEIMARPANGYTHLSTFSGCGGTCLGFRLAGFQTVYANDIDRHARACYRLNFSSPIDGRDIRFVTGADLLERTGLARGALDVFEGSPPCTAFSTAGKRAKGWGDTKTHGGLVQTKIEDLFYEWLRILEELQPRTFVAENVAGMTKGIAKGYYLDVLRKMTALGYQADARLLDAQYLGVPQRRSRVIFLGIRQDLGVAPTFPTPQPWTYSVREALPWLDAARLDPRGQFASYDFIDTPCPTITIGGGSGSTAHHYLVQDGVNHQFKSSAAPSPPIMAGRVTAVAMQSGGVPSRWHSADEPAPSILSDAKHFQRVEQIIGNDDFVPKWGSLDEPHATIMSSGGINTSGQIRLGVHRRKFTIRELKRLCAFPEDFQMTGTYSQQWARFGNSVPPLMAAAIATTLRETLRQVDGR